MTLIRGRNARTRSAKSSLQSSNLPFSKGRLRRSRKARLPFEILELPPEIVGRICEYLEDADLMNVRLVCRALCVHSVVAFGQRFFTHLVAILHPSSLTILMEISRHPELSKHVRKLTISGECVGGIIQFDEEIMQPHIELQASMKRSGLDEFMLANIFQNLGNLEVIGIDNLSFHAERKGLRCGARYIIPEWKDWDYLTATHCRFNPAFEVVFASIDKVPNCEALNWELNIYVKDDAEEHPTDWFGPSFQNWKERFAHKVRSLSYSGSELLSCVPELKSLKCGYRENMTFTDSLSRMFLWPKLHWLDIEDAEIEQHHLVDFLQAHQATLRHLSLNAIEIRCGTCKAVFEVIANMTRLRSLRLWQIWEDISLPHRCDMWPKGLENASEEACEFLIAIDGEILVALHALTSLSLFRLVSGAGWTQDRIDYRLANAAINGEAEDAGGEWVLKR